jgi:hypothetical protein
MTEARPQKKSEILAIENLKRIAEQLRNERNDARAIAQTQQGRAVRAVTLLKEARDIFKNGGSATADLVARIDAALSDDDGA